MSIPPHRPREMALDSHTSRLFASVAGGLLAIDARTGTLLWRSDKGAESRVEIVKDTVLALNDAMFVALERATGAIQWERPGQIQAEEMLANAWIIEKHTLLVFAPDAQGNYLRRILNCYAPQDGQLRWSFLTDVRQSRFEPCLAVAQDTVVLVHEGRLQALALSTGMPRWSFTPDDLITEAPVIQDELVYCGAQDDMLYALNLTDGSVHWQTYLGNELTASPLALGQIVYVAAGRRLVALDGQTGAALWRYKARHSEEVWPVYGTRIVSLGLAEGMVGLEIEDQAPGRKYDSSYSWTFIALDREKGQKRWRRVLGETRGQIIGAYQHLLFLTTPAVAYYEDPLFVLDASTGEHIRTMDKGDRYLIAGGVIYTWSGQRIAAFTADAGTLLWEIPVS